MFGFAARGCFPMGVFVCAVYSVCVPVACGRIGVELTPPGGRTGVSGRDVVDGGTASGTASGSATDGNTAEIDGAIDSSGAVDSGLTVDSGSTIDTGLTADSGNTVDSGDDFVDSSLFTDAGCANVCENPHGTVECIDGVCVPICSSNYGNCDVDASNGCEVDLLTDVNHCGDCTNVCGPYDHATALCVSGSCGLLCGDGYGNCTSDLSDGCETALNTLSNCGGCGVTCSLTHASVSCSTGLCELTACDYGYANCDSDENTGCETQLMDVTNGLRGYWSLDEKSGLVAADGSQYGHNGTLTNMTGGEWATGRENGGLQFDGVNDYADIGNVGAGIKTFSFWVRSDFVVSATDTGEKAPTANGSPNNGWSNGSNAYSNDGSYASVTFLIIGAAAHDWSAVNFGVPAGATIKGIEAKLETKVSSLSLGSYSISLSWDGGSTYTSSKSIPSGLLGLSENLYTLGGATDTWGHTWTVDEINNRFRIKANFIALGLGTVYIDYIRVKVSYLPYDGQKIIDVDGSAAQIELIASDLSATNFPATTAYYVDGISGTALTSGWHHVAITNTTGVNASAFRLGNVSTGTFVGALDEVRVYDRVLNANDIAFLSGAGNTSCP